MNVSKNPATNPSILVSVFLLALVSCNRHTAPVPPAAHASPTVASMVPAATDLLIGMGATDHLVAVSTYDKDPAVAALPRVGDYETVDWELLRSLQPNLLITQIQPARQSPGFTARADALHIKPVNIQIETVDDIYRAMDTLGAALNEPQRAKEAQQQMRLRLQAIHQQVARDRPVRTLIVTDSSGRDIAAPGGFLDDLLQIAGGVNAAPASGNHWPRIDREMLLSLKPDAIIQLLPAASAQERQQAAQFWQRLPQIPAVSQDRVYQIDAPYALLPGWHVTELAERFAQCLHPSPSTSRP